MKEGCRILREKKLKFAIKIAEIKKCFKKSTPGGAVSLKL